MRIAYLSTFYPYRGGIAQFNASLYRAFERTGHEVKAFTFTRQYPEILFPGKSQLVTEQDKADPIPAEQLVDSINPLTWLSASKKIEAFNPDLLVMKFWLPFFGPSLGTVAGKLKKKGTKVITVIDNAIPHEKRIGDMAFSNYFFKRNSGFVVMSSTVKDDLLSVYPRAKFTVANHPVYDHFGDKTDALAAREKLGIPPDKKVLLFFGFVRKYKGLDLLIKAMKQLPEDYFLLAAGEVYGDEKEYHDLVRTNGLEERVKLHFDYIGDNEVPLFFSAADVNVLPYRSATQSGILSMAVHFDMPVIVTDVGSLAEFVSPNGLGLVVDEATENQLAETIRKFFKEGFAEKTAQNIRSFKKENSWGSFAGKIVDFAQNL